jgi:membrane protein YqaA with SNARE-associated domain
MILTPENRYGILQWFTLKFWPILSLFFLGKWSRYRGISVEKLGAAMARNIFQENNNSVERLHWEEIMKISS